MNALEWPSQNQDLNLIKILWHDLKQAIHTQNLSNVIELKQFCKEGVTSIYMGPKGAFMGYGTHCTGPELRN